MEDSHNTADAAGIAPGGSSPGEPGLRRRPIRARGTRWAQAAARGLKSLGLRPNQISVASVGFALLGAAALVEAGRGAAPGTRAVLFVLAGTCVQLRLLCNLFDGLVAVEGGLRTPTGELYNELPDRIADALFLASAGWAAHWYGCERDLGWFAAVLAVLVAYVRALGGQMGVKQQFCGPMAKQQRMFVLTLACAWSAGEALGGWPARGMAWALGFIALGTAATIFRRVRRVARELEA